MVSVDNTVSAVIITGGGRGLGKAIALTLSEKYAVLIVGRTKKDLIETVKQIRDSGGQADYLVDDAARPGTAIAAAAKVEENNWGLEHLVCNAGIGKSRPTHELSDEEWQETIATNLSSCFYFAKAVLPTFMTQKKGTICFISSIAGVRGYAYEAAYTASKHGIVGLSKSLALEYGKYGITSAVICPNFIEGEMTERTIKGLAGRRGISYKEARTVIENLNPQKRIIPAEEVAEVVSFVCDGKAPSLAGNPIILSGGEK